MALLWNPESWSQRLAELEAQSGDLKEAPLRRDVRSLGMLLGEVLREQAGDDLFAHVETLRQGTIRRRDAEAHGDEEDTAALRWDQGRKELDGHGPETGGEMEQKRRLVNELEATDFVATSPFLQVTLKKVRSAARPWWLESRGEIGKWPELNHGSARSSANPESPQN